MAGIGANNTYQNDAGGTMRPTSNQPVKNAQNAMITGTADDIKKVQTALNAAGANLNVDGIWGKNTQAAFQKYGNSALYSEKVPGATKYGTVNSGNGIQFWGTEAERRQKNAAHVAADGLDPNRSMPMFDENWNHIDRGYYGADGTGGVFNVAGFSSNPYYLQSEAGITRDMLKGTMLENIPDALLVQMIENHQPWSDTFTYDPNTWGKVYDPGGENSISRQDIRNEYAKLTGQKGYLDGWSGGITAPLAEIPYYNGGDVDISGLAARQQAILDANAKAMNYYGTAKPGNGLFGNIYWTPETLEAAIASGQLTLAPTGTFPTTPQEKPAPSDTTPTTPGNTKPSDMTDEEWLKYVASLSGLEGW